MSEENAEQTVQNENVDWEARARKAEAKIVDMKKSTTPEPKEEDTSVEAPTNSFDEEAFERKYNEKKFFEANPDMLEYKDKLAEYTAKGLGYNEAKVLLENTDETIRNRQIAKQTNFTSGDTPVAGVSVTREQLENASQSEYNKLKDLIESGKATLTN